MKMTPNPNYEYDRYLDHDEVKKSCGRRGRDRTKLIEYQVKRIITLSWTVDAKNRKEAIEIADDMGESMADMGPEKTVVSKIKKKVK